MQHTGNVYPTIALAEQFVSKNKTKERIFHGNGNGFYGNFIVTKDISKYTTSNFFSEVGKKFKIAVRFSNTIAEHGTSELMRDNRGFAIRFFNNNEIWDLVGLNTPIQWIETREDILLFHDAMEKSPYTGILDIDRKWDFIYNTPSSLHILTMIYSDRGIPSGWQNMNGYGCNTFSLINKNDEKVWVKFHLKTQQGNKWYTEEEAAKVSFDDPNKLTRDMYNLILNKKYPKWKMFIQVMEEQGWKDLDFNPFSSAQVWPHGKFPLIEIGEIEINELPTDQIEEFDKIAFGPGNLPTGIGISPDISLISRVISYPKLQSVRLNKNNINELPKHIKKEMDYYRRDDIYIKCHNSDLVNDYSQPRNLWNSFSKEEKSRLYKNIARHLSKANQSIIDNQIYLLNGISTEYGDGVLKEIKKINDK
jgi:catalase